MIEDPALLTIAIPTYNRAAKLQAQIERLVPQLTPKVRLHVYDNASTDGTGEVVQCYADHITYSKASVNCGAGRNIFRCMEGCKTEWLWILSDDDLARPTAVQDALTLIDGQSCDFIHTCSDWYPHPADLRVNDVPTLFENANIGQLTWLSSGLYRTAAIRPLFWIYNEGLSTWAPQLIVQLSLLSSGKSAALLSPLRLTTPPISEAIPWSTLKAILRFSLVPEYLPESIQQAVADKIFLEWFDEFFLNGLRETSTARQVRRWKRIHSQAFHNLKGFGGRSSWHYIWHNWYRPRLRRITLSMAIRAASVLALRYCPLPFFHFLVRLLPLDQNLRAQYEERAKYMQYR